MSKSSKQPSHLVYAVTREGKQSYWRKIGAAWAHKDGEGYGVQLDYLPLNDAEIVIRTPRLKDDEAEAVPETEVA